MKKRVIGGLLMASALVLVAGATQLSAPTASAEGIKYTDTTGLIQMIDGASVRVADTTTSGIRFAATMNKAKYDEFEAANGGEDKVCAGIIIIPSDYLGGGNATAFTHEALTAKYGADGYSYSETTSFKLSADGNSYQFAVSLVNMRDYNYARDFVATAYIKVDKDTGAEYTYASFDQDADARNIYEVAHAAYNDRKTAEEGEYTNAVEYDGVTTYSKMSEDGLKAAKSYMDKIAAVTKDGDTVTDNDTAYYVSPYQVSGANGSYILDGKGKAPVDVLYNGEIVTTDYITDGDTQVAMVQNQATAWNEDGSVTLTGVYSANANAGTFNDVSVKNYIGYYGFRGNFGVGHYVDVTFTGNNMPYVMFFSDTIDGNLSNRDTGKKGMVVVNGIVSTSAEDYQNYDNRLNVFGPNRISGVAGTDMLIEYATKKTTYPGLTSMTQASLKANADTKYRYIVGTSLAADDTITIEMYLYDLDNSVQVAKVIANTGKTATDLPAGNIVLYGAAKGLASGSTTKAEASTFTINAISNTLSLPTGMIQSSGATFNEDGSVTLKGVLPANGNPGTLFQAEQQSNYIGWQGDYGVGTYVEFTFTGKNMPNVLLFADSINGNITDRSATGTTNSQVGYMLLNQMKTDNTGLAHVYEHFAVWGPNRVNQNGDQLGTNWVLQTGYLKADEGNKDINYNADLVPFRLAALDDTHQYKYTVSTKVESDVVVIVLNLQDITAETTVSAEISTGKTVAEIGTGNIVAYAAFKGAAGSNTTFSYTAPYTK